MNNLVALLRQTEMTQEEIADKLQVHQTTVSMWFLKKSLPNKKTRRRIIDLLRGMETA